MRTDRWLRVLGMAAVGSLAAFGADLCGAADVHGSYGFQLSGTTTIGGVDNPAPIASVGRLTFDGSGNVSGTTSVNFNGYFLGNPTAGKYELRPDCSVTLSLQDPSGGFQHFTGKSAQGGGRVEILQSDEGAGAKGVMMRAPDSCNTQMFNGPYNFSMSGSSTPLASGGPAGNMSAKATVQADGNGKLTVVRGEAQASGTYAVDSDCFVEMDLTVSGADASASSRLRGTLVNDGKEILAIETDPRRVAAARFAQ